MANIIHAAVVQMCSKQNVEENLQICEQLTIEAAHNGANLVILPENFTYIGNLKEKLILAEPLTAEDPGPVLKRMLSLAFQQHIYLLLGGMPIVSENSNQFYNTAILIGPDGKIIASYRKIHLFDINIPGQAVFKESDYVIAGKETVTAKLLGTTIGLSICYDLRFPELYRRLVAQGACLISVPAAFTLHTGKDHWFPMLRSRAIENQVYLLAAAQFGHHLGDRTSYGKSCIIDPWGAVIAQVPDQTGFALAALDLDYLGKIRQQLPALQHRKLQ